MFRAIFICIFLPLYMLVAGPPLLLYTLISRNPNPLYWGGVKGVVFLLRVVGVKVRIAGRERVPAGACLFVANHTSSADAPAVVGAIPRRVAILLKESLFKWPIAGQAFALAGFIPVNRSERESAVASVEKATQSLRGGQSFLIYPEGTRSPDGRLQAFKKGAVVMAIKSGVPIVTIACTTPWLRGCRRISGRLVFRARHDVIDGHLRALSFSTSDSSSHTRRCRSGRRFSAAVFLSHWRFSIAG